MNWGEIVEWADGSPVIAGIVGTFIGGVLLAIFSSIVIAIARRARPSFKWIPDLFRWISQIRITTSTRQVAFARKAATRIVRTRSSAKRNGEAQIRLVDEATARGNKFADQYIDAERARRDADDLLDDRTAQVKKWREDSKVAREAAADTERRFRIAVEALADAENEKAQLKSELEAARADKPAPAPSTNLPLPRPRWSVYPHPDNDEYCLRNAVDRSIANEVRLDLPFGNFDFHDGAHWKSMSGSQVMTFRGDPTGNASTHGVIFDVTWYDENDEKDFQRVTLPPWEDAPQESDYPF